MSSAEGAAPPADAPAEGAEAEAPRDERLEAVVEAMRSELGDALLGSHIRVGDDVWVRVANDAWRTAAEAAAGRLGCKFFDFLSAIDWLPSPFGRDMTAEVDNILGGVAAKDPVPMTQGYAGGESRMQVIARLYSISSHQGITLKADVADDDPRIASLVPLYAGANWHERECWEMYGITFVGHPMLAKLYLPGSFEGHPLRKDFPLLARRVKPWPGIVDVEPMPGNDDDADAAEGA